jgi:biofilm PGA synthesis N-glycosyltransferase PgaC
MSHLLGLWVVVYPAVMALAWCLLALLFAWRREWGDRSNPRPTAVDRPPVSVLIPCFNEGPLLKETLHAALTIDWPDWEVIAIDDGSQDDTGLQLDAWAASDPRLRVVHLARNQGKALALRAGALLARHEWLICIDGDALLDPGCVEALVGHLRSRPRLGAVTGNPRIRNRTSLLGRVQVGEFAMIVGLIKRAQSMLGGLFCVSGVVAAFRRRALHEVGYWNPNCLTEDIDITWRLQRAGWQVDYEPRARVWILMPETLRGLWRQRLRWAEGGLQVVLANLDLLRHPRQWHLLPLMLETLFSLVWAWSLLLLMAIDLAGLLGAHLSAVPLPQAGGTLWLFPLALLQLLVSLGLDRPYDRGLRRNAFWMIWYFAAFWLIGFATAVLALPRLLAKRLRGRPRLRARWVSPDRGMRA